MAILSKKEIDKKLADGAASAKVGKTETIPPAGQIEPVASGQEQPQIKRGRGRPAGSPNRVKDGEPVTGKPFPLPDENEAKGLSVIIAMFANQALKIDKYPQLETKPDDVICITRPLTQLRQYYFPNAPEAWAAWSGLILGVVGFGYSKYKIMKELKISEPKKPSIAMVHDEKPIDHGSGVSSPASS
jgi:hypothetical protein